MIFSLLCFSSFSIFLFTFFFHGHYTLILAVGLSADTKRVTLLKSRREVLRISVLLETRFGFDSHSRFFQSCSHRIFSRHNCIFKYRRVSVNISPTNSHYSHWLTEWKSILFFQFFFWYAVMVMVVLLLVLTLLRFVFILSSKLAYIS